MRSNFSNSRDLSRAIVSQILNGWPKVQYISSTMLKLNSNHIPYTHMLYIAYDLMAGYKLEKSLIHPKCELQVKHRDNEEPSGLTWACALIGSLVWRDLDCGKTLSPRDTDMPTSHNYSMRVESQMLPC